ncbi:unnamed protein product [Pedinophyceae sp. YPF-701]|nr:unnamed protein product [Pedinophyceae sp. YPF-701]
MPGPPGSGGGLPQSTRPGRDAAVEYAPEPTRPDGVMGTYPTGAHFHPNATFGGPVSPPAHPAEHGESNGAYPGTAPGGGPAAQRRADAPGPPPLIKPMQVCCGCVELRSAVITCAAVQAAWFFLEGIYALHAVDKDDVSKYDNAMPDDAKGLLTFYGLWAFMYILPASILGIVACAFTRPITEYRPWVLRLTKVYAWMMVGHMVFVLTINIAVKGVQRYSLEQERYAEENPGFEYGTSRGLWTFEQVLWCIVLANLGIYFTYVPWSYNTKLQQQARGVFDGYPVLHRQADEMGIPRPGFIGSRNRMDGPYAQTHPPGTIQMAGAPGAAPMHPGMMPPPPPYPGPPSSGPYGGPPPQPAPGVVGSYPPAFGYGGGQGRDGPAVGVPVAARRPQEGVAGAQNGAGSGGYPGGKGGAGPDV